MTALDDLQAVMFKWAENLSVIKPKLDCRGQGTGIRWWRIQLVEESDDYESGMFYSKRIDEYVNWTNDKLKDWPNVKRMAWDMWDFKHRKDAEKFITIFHLSWEQ